MKKVLAFGTFDILHPGHKHALKEAKKHGDSLTVIVARDATVCHVKGQEAVFNETERVKNLQKLKIADKVRLGCLDNKYQVVDDENPDIIALGYDQTFFTDKLNDVVKKHVKIVRLAPYKPEIYKSSLLRRKLKKSV